MNKLVTRAVGGCLRQRVPISSMCNTLRNYSEKEIVIEEVIIRGPPPDLTKTIKEITRIEKVTEDVGKDNDQQTNVNKTQNDSQSDNDDTGSDTEL